MPSRRLRVAVPAVASFLSVVFALSPGVAQWKTGVDYGSTTIMDLGFITSRGSQRFLAFACRKLGMKGFFPLVLRKSPSDALVCVVLGAPKPQKRRA